MDAFFHFVGTLRYRAALMTAYRSIRLSEESFPNDGIHQYGAGLRVSEVVRLKVSDIDSKRELIRVEQGKGKRDRYAMLPKRLLPVLRAWWRVERSRDWLFPGRRPGRHMDAQTLQLVCGQAAELAGIAKRVRVHTLRHSFGRYRSIRLSEESFPNDGIHQYDRSKNHLLTMVSTKVLPRTFLTRASTSGSFRKCWDTRASSAPLATPRFRPAWQLRQRARWTGWAWRSPAGGRNSRAVYQPAFERAGIFRSAGPAYGENNTVPREQQRAMDAIVACRTAALGGHAEECDQCPHTRVSYNSCRNRNC